MSTASTREVDTITVMAPKDADGPMVPPDTKVMYDDDCMLADLIDNRR